MSREPAPQQLAESKTAPLRLDVNSYQVLAAGLLVDQLRYVSATSAFYRERWDAWTLRAVEAIDAADVVELVKRLPFTTKDELRQAQEATSPFGTYLACGLTEVARVHRTSGTTGRPLVIGASQTDNAQTATVGGRTFRCAGLRPTDTVVHCLNYCMWMGGLTDHMCLEATGAAVVPFGVGNTSMLAGLQAWLPFSALSCTPSYLPYLLELLNDQARELWRANLRLVLVGGEPGGSEPALQKMVREQLGAELMNANYGLAEVVSNFASECEHRRGLHFHGHDALWAEVVDPATGRSLPLATGARGELVLTHTRRQAQPLVRYRTSDAVEIVATDPCPCGRAGFRFVLHGRIDDMFVVRGINVFPTAIAKTLGRVVGAPAHFAVVLPDQPIFDEVPLILEGAPGDAGQVLAQRAEAAIKEQIGCSASIRIVPHGSLERTGEKARRVYRDGQLPPIPPLRS